MMRSYYKAIKQENSYCPKCGKKIYKLLDDERQDSPKFNICFECKFIGHVGVGKVEVDNFYFINLNKSFTYNEISFNYIRIFFILGDYI